MHAYLTYLAAQLAFTWMVGILASGQTLQITSPADGTVIHPGETFSVTVNSPDTAFQFVGLVGEGPIGFVALKPGVPAHFSLTIPADFNICRKYLITAIGVIVPGKNADSQPIEIDVERPDLPIKLTALMPKFYFQTPGGSLPIELIATFNDRRKLDVHESTRIAFSSSNPKIAKVSEDGIVTARSPGNAQAIATYALDGRKVQLAIPVAVEVGPLASSAYALDFRDQPAGTASAEQQITLANRTLGPIRVLSIETTGDFVETDNCSSQSPLGPHWTCTLKISFSPRIAGVREGAVTINDDFSSESLIVPLSGTGQR
jgi:hypothetical protein